MTEPGLDGNLRYTGEGMEDMSLSSASSLERNDTSEEFLDDFDNLGDQLQIGIPQNKYPVATPTQTRLQGLLNETMDWTRIGLAGIAKCYSSNYCVYVTQYSVDNIVLLWQECSVYAVLYYVSSQVARQIQWVVHSVGRRSCPLTWIVPRPPLWSSPPLTALEEHICGMRSAWSRWDTTHTYTVAAVMSQTSTAS